MMVILVLAISAFASYKLAEEKRQNKILWTIGTALVGPLLLVVQYLLAWYSCKNEVK
ncbi:hypothetical protein H9660_01620 [Clostridium sp. Sa3CUN1]|uniref:Cardiolipin synthase N-terminal domain-containing protein n=1 Tax=Clostridium gallinarum TaxID=2762246 RepID=A0ABR8Q0A6_9CLOT|nr:hypothetical protein [Clostridium gallinarum]MBD7913837.1 hypothetical protein [Clostridium gallinarum]